MLTRGSVIEVAVGTFNAIMYSGYVVKDDDVTLTVKTKEGKFPLLWEDITFVRETFDPTDKTYSNIGHEHIYEGGQYFEGAEARLRESYKAPTFTPTEQPYDYTPPPDQEDLKIVMIVAVCVGAVFFLMN